MPFVGSIIPASIATPKQAKKTPKAKKGGKSAAADDEKGAFARTLDEADLSVTETGESAGERKIAAHASEDSAEDREGQAYYSPKAPKADQRPNDHGIDLKG